MNTLFANFKKMFALAALVCLCSSAYAFSSGDTIVIYGNSKYLTATGTNQTSLEWKDTPTTASLWVITNTGGNNYTIANLTVKKNNKVVYLCGQSQGMNTNLALTTTATNMQSNGSNNFYCGIQQPGSRKTTTYYVQGGNTQMSDRSQTLTLNTYKTKVEYSGGYVNNVTEGGTNVTDYTWTWEYKTIEFEVPGQMTRTLYMAPTSGTTANITLSSSTDCNTSASCSAGITDLSYSFEDGTLNPTSVSVSGAKITITTEDKPMYPTYDFANREDVLVITCKYKGTPLEFKVNMLQPVAKKEAVSIHTYELTPTNYTFENIATSQDFKLIETSLDGYYFSLSNSSTPVFEGTKSIQAASVVEKQVGIRNIQLADNWTATVVDDTIIRVTVDASTSVTDNPEAKLQYIRMLDDGYETYESSLDQIVNESDYTFSHQKGVTGSDLDSRHMQSVHTAYNVVYMKQGSTYTFEVPEGTFRGYWRWYDYATDLKADNLSVPGSPITTKYGHFKTRTALSNGLATFTLNDNAVHYIACDVSNYTDYTFANSNKEITEPTLSFRVIYEIHPATEMADSLEKCTGSVYYEEHKITAGTCNNIYLPTNYPFAGTSSSYYIYANGVAYQVSSLKWTRDTGSGEQNFTPVSTPNNKYAEVNNSGSTGTVTYYLKGRAKINNNTYTNYRNIAKFVVEYKACSEVGPVREANGGIYTDDELDAKYIRLAKLDFDYNTPGTTSYTTYNTPLGWTEASYGFCYSDYSNPQGYRYVESAFPYWGEYMFINTTKGSPGESWLNSADNRSGAANGYMLYCDGTSVAGTVASLDLKAQLCAGSKMYCSAWINSASTDNSEPVFQFQLVGIDADGVEHQQTTFTTGTVAKSLGWQQVFFTIESDDDYESYRLRISNHCSSGSGNDFLIDDIRVYQSSPAISSSQSTTACQEEGQVNIITPLTRIDFQSIGEDVDGMPLYYQWYNETAGFIITGLDYINSNAANTCGHFSLPTDDDDVEANYSSYIYTSSSELLEAHSSDSEKRIGYVKETVDGDTHYVLYVAEDMACGSDTTVTMRAAFREQDLDHALCAMNSSFTVVPRVQLTLDGIPMGSEPEQICGNRQYTLAMRVYDSHDRISTCLSDWIHGSPADSTDASNIAVYGCTYDEMLAAIYDLRTPITEDDGNTNPNLSVTSLSAVNRSYISDANYTILNTMVQRGLLDMGTNSLDILILSNAAEVDLRRTVVPINGTCPEGYEVCNVPIKAVFNLCSLSGYNLTLGNRDEVEKIQSYIRGVRVAKDFTSLYLPIDTSYMVEIDTITLLMSTDPSFVSESETRCVLKSDITDFTKWTTDKQGVTLTIDNTASNFTLKSGYSYTFGMRLVNTFQKDTITDEETGHKCPVGTVYFNVCIVPDSVVWSPVGQSNSWNDDNNWTMVDADGNELRGGYVPLAHTNVIIPDLGENGVYPALNTSTNVPTKQYLPVDEGAQQYISYDFNYHANVCNNIHFKTNAEMLNQHVLTYNKAWVEMLFPTQRWQLMAFPLNGVVAGDMYVPEDNYASAAPFTSGNQCTNRYNYMFWQSLFNKSVSTKTKDNSSVDVTDVSWSKSTNSVSYEYPVGTGGAFWGYKASDLSVANLVIRLPKTDTQYAYYDPNSGSALFTESISRSASVGRLGYVPTISAGDTTMTIHLENASAGKLFLFGNPALACLDIRKLVDANSDILSGTFYYIPESAGYDDIDMTACTKYTASSEEYMLLPYKAVLLETKSSTNNIDLKVRPNMYHTASQLSASQPVLAPARRNVRTAANENNVALLNITTKMGDYYSGVVLGETYRANDGYVSGEDAELLTFENMVDGTTPDISSAHATIYSPVDGKALSVNVLNELENVPLAYHICSSSDYEDHFTMWVGEIDDFPYGLQLYDAQTQTTVPLMNGMMFELESTPSDVVRYYIQKLNYSRDNGGTTDLNEATDFAVSAYTQPDKSVHVVSTEDLQAIEVINIIGQNILSMNGLASNTAEFNLPVGAYLVNITTQNGTKVVRKVVVR